MNWIGRGAALFLAFGCWLGGFAAGIGDSVPELELGPMLKGERFRFADKRGELVVLHFWKTGCPPCVEAVARINELIARYPGKAAFLAVGTELPSRLRSESHWKEFRCPVASDAMAQLSDCYLPRRRRFPLDAVIGPDRKLLWLGPTAELARVLDEILTGKYDLKAAIELDRFNRAMADALTKKDHVRALNTLRERRKAFPDDLALAIGEADILAGMCGRPEEALAVLDRALAGHPKVFPLHFAKLRILRTLDRSARSRRIAACEAVAREFHDRPALLTQLAAGMLKQPPGSLELLGIWHLAHTAYRASALRPLAEQGRAAATLARCYYCMGMAERALLLQTEAVKAFGGSREAVRAAADLEIYRDALNAADEVRKREKK